MVSISELFKSTLPFLLKWTPEIMNRLLNVSAAPQPFRKHQEDTEVAVLEALEPTEAHALIVWNDEVNTFDHVIEALIEICDHSPEQAEQCAMIIHLKGKYAVKNGTFDVLRPCCEALIDRGINATIGG